MRRALGENLYMSTGEAARVLGVSAQTIRNWADQGILGCARVRRRGYVSARLIERRSVVQFEHGVVPRDEPEFDRKGLIRRLQEDAYRKMGVECPIKA